MGISKTTDEKTGWPLSKDDLNDHTGMCYFSTTPSSSNHTDNFAIHRGQAMQTYRCFSTPSIHFFRLSQYVSSSCIVQTTGNAIALCRRRLKLLV